MNYSIIIYILGWIMNVEAVCMLVPGITALIYRENPHCLLPDHDSGMSGHRCSNWSAANRPRKRVLRPVKAL